MVKEHYYIQANLIKLVAKNTVAVELMIKWKDMVFISIHRVQFIQVNGKIINKKVKVYMNLQMEQYMTVNERIIKCMEKDNL